MIKKVMREKKFAAFTDFQQTVKVFPTNLNTRFNMQNSSYFCSYILAKS